MGIGAYLHCALGIVRKPLIFEGILITLIFIDMWFLVVLSMALALGCVHVGPCVYRLTIRGGGAPMY